MPISRDRVALFFFSSRRRHTRLQGDWSSDVCSSDLKTEKPDGKYSQEENENRGIFLERLGSAYADNNNEAAAIETFQKMLTLGDDNAERGYGAMIDTYRENKEWQKATDVAPEGPQKLCNKSHF